MSEQFKVAANAEDFLGQVDEAKKAQEAASFWSQQLGEDIIDGDRDSEQSKQRIGEVDEYAKHLQSLSERDEAYDALSADDGTERNSLNNQSLKDLAEAAKKAHAEGNEQGSMILQDAIQEKLINSYGELVLNGKLTQEQADAAILNQIDSIGRIISGEHTDSIVASDGEAHVKPSATFASVENNPSVQVVFSDNETPAVPGVREAGVVEEDLTNFETEAPSESEVAEDARVAALAAAEKASQNVRNEAQPLSREQGTGDQTTEVLPPITMDREAVANFVAQAASNNVRNAVNATPGTGERSDQNTAEVEEQDHEEENTASSQKTSRSGLAKFIKNAKNVARAKRVKVIQKSNEAPVDQSDGNEPAGDDSGKKTTLLGRLRRAAQESFKSKSSDTAEAEDVLTTPITNVNGGEVSSPADENTTDVVPRRVERSAAPEPLTVTAYSEVPNGYYGAPQAARSEDAPTTTVIPQRDASQASFRRS